VNDLRRRGLSRKTILNALSTLASMLSVARDWDYLAPELDWRKLRLPVEELQEPQRFFTPDESQPIIDTSPEPWNICFTFMAYLGLRTSEAVGAAWESIDLHSGVLRVRQSNWRGKLLTVKSKSSVRDLPLPPVLVDMLNDYRLRWKPNTFGLLFANAKGQPITSCYVRRDILHPIRERLGIPRGAFPCLPARPGHRIDAGRRERACCTAAARSHRLANAGALRARRSARSTSSGRTHRGRVFAAFCGELGC
jgi:integrase